MEPTDDAAPSADVERAPSPVPSGPSALRLPLILSLLLSLAAGGILVGIVLAVFPIFKVPAELMAPFPPPEVAVAREASISQTRTLNAAVALGILALAMSGLLGAAEAAARRFAGGTLLRLAAGVLLATVLGCLSGVLGQFLLERLSPVESLVPMVRTFLVQACMLGLFGAGLGAALGLVTGDGRTVGSSTLSGLMAGVVVAFVFPIVCGLTLPRVQTEVVIPGGLVGGRKDWVGLVVYFAFLVVIMGLLLPLTNRRVRKTATS